MEKKNCLEDYPWPEKRGVRYGELKAWLKENSGYTSNRMTDKILREAQMIGIVMKRLNTRRYYRVVPR
jgi:hypothetical protein